jgi:hypothetical protein
MQLPDLLLSGTANINFDELHVPNPMISNPSPKKGLPKFADN